MYASAMDSAGIEQKGISPLTSDLQRIAFLQTPNDILKEVTTEYSIGLNTLFNFYANQDDKNSSRIVAHFDQGGLGLPNKDYYTNQDSATVRIRNAYIQYIQEALRLAGDDSLAIKSESDAVMNI